MVSSLPEKLADLLGNGYIVPSHLLSEYAIDGLTPRAVVQPSSREAIAEVLRWASSEKLAVMPRGGGTQLALGNLPERVDLVLDLGRYSRMLDYQPADLTATVEAGITLEHLQEELAQAEKLAPLEAPLAERATIGGILATSASGPLRHSYGLARDWLIGISVISADGTETRAGGKVVKNVTGYDLNKLYTGSLGTLGVIVEATFKLAPVPTESGALVAAVPSLQDGVALSRKLLAQVFAPQGIQVMNEDAARRLELPFTASNGEAIVVAFFAGRARAVQRRLDESARVLKDGGASRLEHMEQESASQLLRRITDLGWSSDSAPHLGLKVNIPPTAVFEAVSWPQEIKVEAPPSVVADPGFGIVRLLWWDSPDSPDRGDRSTITIVSQVRELARRHGGSAVIEHCPLSVKQDIDVWGDTTQTLDLMRRIKHNLDPSGILNPGRFIGRL